ncbi:AraC family transcriptional regulator [Nocardia sp. NPDC052566]|uniref:AraC family transcriptional regulator n=1 Tax=Nocardia sp. NPDC052566 TaxID=3364330 RepID=UPI0037CCB7AB
MAKLDPFLNAATIPPTILYRLEGIATRRGYVTDAWFAGTGVTADQLGLPGVKLSFHQTAQILRRALRMLPDEPFGMMVGVRDVDAGLGMLGLAMRSCSTVGGALELGMQLHQAMGSVLDFEAEYFGDKVAVRLHERAPEPELLRFLCEDALTALGVFARSLVGGTGSPTLLQLRYPEPGYGAEYRRFFRCPVQFDAEANRMVFPAWQLDQPLPTHSEASRALAIDACLRLLDPGDTRPDIIASVEAMMSRNLRQPLTMAEVASRLSITERTLRRQLTDAGTRFSALRDDVRHRRAAYLVAETRMTIAEIAAEVGFSDPREFRRAFIRWTGGPPSAARRVSGPGIG